MELINKELKIYLQNNILPIYDKNDQGHGLLHINNVIERCLEFSSQFPNIKKDILYTIAIYHDIAHHINKDNHEVLSAKIFYEDNNMKQFFTEEDRLIMKDAIEDHRASLKENPRNIYGKILSSADRTYDIEEFMTRAHSYTKKHYPNLIDDQIIDRAYLHLQEKYGHKGYAKMYVYDQKYEDFKTDVENLIQNKNEFKKRYLKANKYRLEN